MADEPDDSQGREPLSWRIRRWAAPLAMAVSVAASIAAVHVLADERPPTADSHAYDRRPRFILTAGRLGNHPTDDGPEPWLQVSAFQPDGRTRPVDSVEPPSPSAGEAREILTGPKGTFVVVASREKPCESRFYRFRLTGDGHVKGIEPLRREPVPARVAGPAFSPDGGRLAYATAPCASGARQAAEPRATVTVSDLGSGRRRTWSTAAPSVVGEIVWAGDGRTLGYTVSDVRPDASSGSGVQPEQTQAVLGREVDNVTVHALDTHAQGTELRAGRVLFRGPADSGSVTTVVMNPDGRTGYGAMRTARPPSTVLFSFSEGEPMRVTRTIPRKPNTLTAIALIKDDGPRYACLNGLDAFGRVVEGGFMENPGGGAACGPAYAY